MKKSIKRRLIGSYLLLIVITVALFETIALTALLVYYKQGITQELRSQGAMFASFYEQEIVSGTLADEAELLMLQYNFHINAQIQLIDAEGNVLADSHKTAVKNVAQKEDVKKAAAHPAAASEIVNGEKVLSLTYPFLSNGSWTNAIRYTTSLAPVYAVFTENAVIVLAIGGAVIVAAALIGFLLARTIVTPISQMTAAAEQMADGNFAARVPAGKSDELGKLSNTLNYMASQVEQHEKLKNEFIASVSHDLRTPLTSVKGWAITLHAVAKDEEMRDGLEIIRDESERLSLLLGDLLDFSSLSSGSVSFRFEALDLQSILQQITQQLSPRAEKNGIQLIFEMSAAPLIIEADKSRLYQLFINLLDNALKFTPDGGSVTVSAAPSNGLAAVRITDTGIGIAADELDSVKQKFIKGKSKGAGTGLGLAICEEIAAGHDGVFRLYSTPGQGTTAEILLPLKQTVTVL